MKVEELKAKVAYYVRMHAEARTAISIAQRMSLEMIERRIEASLDLARAMRKEAMTDKPNQPTLDTPAAAADPQATPPGIAPNGPDQRPATNTP